MGEVFSAEKLADYSLAASLLNQPAKQYVCGVIFLYLMLFAILLPGISMIFRGHVLKGILCGVLHLTLIGWIPAAIWAVASYQQDLAEKRHRETLAVLARQGRAL